MSPMEVVVVGGVAMGWGTSANDWGSEGRLRVVILGMRTNMDENTKRDIREGRGYQRE